MAERRLAAAAKAAAALTVAAQPEDVCARPHHVVVPPLLPETQGGVIGLLWSVHAGHHPGGVATSQVLQGTHPRPVGGGGFAEQSRHAFSSDTSSRVLLSPDLRHHALPHQLADVLYHHCVCTGTGGRKNVMVSQETQGAPGASQLSRCPAGDDYRLGSDPQRAHICLKDRCNGNWQAA